MTAPLAERLREQADQCRAAGSPLMHALLRGAADDLDAGGVVADLLGPLQDDPVGTVPALRFAAAVHRLVLERRAPLLATHYPSVGGTAPVFGLWPVARDTVEEHLEELRSLVRHPVQTNEVGRAAVLLGGLAVLSADDRLPVRLLEIGASAGLNLLADRFALRVQGRLRGPSSSPVVLDEPWSGDLPPDLDVDVVERLGCDPAPLDPRTTEGRLTLTSCVWADQRERFERLRGALAMAEQVPLTVRAQPASVFLAEELAPREGVRTVVWHSVVRQYMTHAERDDVDRLVAAAGERATASAPVVRLSLEPERVGDALFRFRVSAQEWPGGQVRVLADAEGHGPPVVWRPRPV